MSQKKNKPSSDDRTNTLDNKADYAVTDNRIPKEVEEEFFPEPKKHPETTYLDEE